MFRCVVRHQEGMSISCFLLIYGLVLAADARLAVPGSTKSEWVQDGDIMLGFLIRIRGAAKVKGEERCNLEPPVHVNALQSVEAVRWTIDSINDRTDLLPNITLGFVAMDTCTDGVDQHTLARSLSLLPDNCGQGHDILETSQQNTSEDQSAQGHHTVVGVVGPSSSREAVAVASVFSVFKIPVLSTLSTSDELLDKSRFEYFQSLSPPNRVSLLPLFDIIRHYRWKYIVILYGEGSYGEYGFKIMEKLAERHGLCVAFTGKLPAKNEPKKFNQLVTALAGHPNAKVVIVFAEHLTIRRFFKHILEDGRKLDRIWIGGEDTDKMARKPEAQAAHGMFYIKYPITKLAAFSAYFKFSLSPMKHFDNPWLRDCWEGLFNCTFNQEDETDVNPSCADLAVSFNNSRRVKPQVEVSKYYDGTLVYAHAIHSLIQETCPEAFLNSSIVTECIKGDALLRHMKLVTFEGSNGLIQFGGDGDPLTKYEIWQIHENTYRPIVPRPVIVGTWDQRRNQTLFLHKDRLHWKTLENASSEFHMVEVNGLTIPESVCSQPCGEREFAVLSDGGCCWTCIGCRRTERVVKNETKCEQCPPFYWPAAETGGACMKIPPSYFRLDNPAWIGFSALSTLAIILAVAAVIVFLKYRKTKGIKATNLHLSLIMLGGVILASLSALFYLARPSDFICTSRQWGFHLSVNCLYSPFFFKTLQIHRIFKGGKKGKTTLKYISSRWQRVFTIFTIGIMVAILTALQIAFGVSTDLRMPMENVKFVELVCPQDLLRFLLPLSYNVLLILLGGFLGFSVRKLPDNFNESGFIFISVSTTLFTWAVFLPIFYTAFYAESQIIIIVACLLINVYITILIFFGSKVYAVFFVDESNFVVSALSATTTITPLQSTSKTPITTLSMEVKPGLSANTTTKQLVATKVRMDPAATMTRVEN